jgi:hypothetical protein
VVINGFIGIFGTNVYYYLFLIVWEVYDRFISKQIFQFVIVGFIIIGERIGLFENGDEEFCAFTNLIDRGQLEEFLGVSVLLYVDVLCCQIYH